MESAKKKSEQTWKTDKSSASTHREFLDMDTDEEDIELHETSETEEEFVSEPKEQIFTDGELTTLVEHVKRLTVLPSLTELHWNEGFCENVRQYFRNPRHALLSVFYDGVTVSSSLSIPDNTDNFVYFLRSFQQTFTVDNFLDTITFGIVNGNCKSAVLKFMESIYTPVLFSDNEWTGPIKKDGLYLNLYEFLFCLVEDVYRPMNLTVLYLPKEGFCKEQSSCGFKDEEQKEIIVRLERTVRCWIKQIRRTFAMMYSRRNVESVADEVAHWNTIYTDLNCLYNQVFSQEIQDVINILATVNSTAVESFRLLIAQMHTKLDEVASNLAYLNTFLVFCENSNIPDEIDAFVRRMLLQIVFIWAESTFYNEPDHAEILLRALGMQIIHDCKNYINLDVIFGGDAENGIETIKRCIHCCEKYKAIYSKVVESVVPHVEPHKKWSIREENIFSHVKTFTQRCYDLIEICNATIVFGRCNKVGIFGGTKGTEYEIHCRKIEDLFSENLNTLISVQDDILDVNKSTWSKHNHRFLSDIQNLEHMAKNLIENVFDNVKNIEEGIEAMYALRKFKQRQPLDNVLRKKWMEIWKIFGKEIKDYSTIDEINGYRSSIRHHLKDENISCIKERCLERQHRILTKAVDWMGSFTVDS